MFHERKWEGYLVSTDPGRLNIGTVHGFLTNSYWARGVPPDVVQRSIENSLVFDVYGDLVGVASREGVGRLWLHASGRRVYGRASARRPGLSPGQTVNAFTPTLALLRRAAGVYVTRSACGASLGHRVHGCEHRRRGDADEPR